jgi:acetolactate synthase small subunit
MLLSRIVLQLPDRPGALGLVTTLLGRLGVDIHQMFVLERDGGRATDEFTAVVPGTVVLRRLPDLLEEIDGVTVLEVVQDEQISLTGHLVSRRNRAAASPSTAGRLQNANRTIRRPASTSS